jgi:hypothetical protein
MLGAQETIGKISLLRDNVCTDIDRPAPDKAIFHSLYPFDLSQNLPKKPDLLQSCLRIHQSRAYPSFPPRARRLSFPVR